MGIGRSLLQYLFKFNKSSYFLVGTWQDAAWAIQFYEKFGFIRQNKKQTAQLLNIILGNFIKTN